jgi:hypothetical protein
LGQDPFQTFFPEPASSDRSGLQSIRARPRRTPGSRRGAASFCASVLFGLPPGFNSEATLSPTETELKEKLEIAV